MAKTPPPSPGGFYHVTLSLDALDDPLSGEGFTARPVSDTEAAELIKRFREIGRNQPCLCGSGRKFKRCCLKKAH